MYGFFSLALEKMVRQRFGDDKWEEICELAGVSLGDSYSFQVHHVYEEQDIHSLLKTASTILGLDQSTILELFGEEFLAWCADYGQSETLKLLGRSLQDFLANLDSLHDHVSTIYPQMIPPSFRCSPGRRGNEFLLHYHSRREGLEPLVSGLVKSIAREYFKMEVRVELLVKRGEEGSDHSVFTVQELARYAEGPAVDTLRCSAPRLFSEEQLVTPDVFCKSFPFHIVFNRQLEILQCGTTLSVLLSGLLQTEPCISSHFTVDHPLIRFSFDAILSHINTYFVLRMTCSARFGLCKDAEALSLRGQMVYLRESDSILFLCSPRVRQLHDLKQAGLYLSDIPLHDATRGLLMIGQAAELEFMNSVHLEELIIKLQSVQKSLEEEKQRMAGLLREMLPISVADSLMAGKMVEAERFESVTILFSDIVQFTSICSRSEPMEIVNMLNKLYSCFDQCVDQNQVYKVETIGDAYMVVGGLPQRNTTHAECVANQALDMMYYCRRVRRPDNGNPIMMRIGIHSGKVVAGIVGVRMPRYCLFGNTVNVASRTESGSVPGRIQVTEHTYNLLKHNPQLSFTYRGPMEFKNVPDPIPCYFLLENSAKSKPTPVSVPFSEDLVPGYDLSTRPTPFLSIGARRSSPPPSPAVKYSSLLTVPALSQDDPEAPPTIPPKRPTSCSSSSSSSTLQSRGDGDVAMTTLPDIAMGDEAAPGKRQLMVPVPDISVTVASSSPSPIVGVADSTRKSRRSKSGGTKVLLRGSSVDDVGSTSDRSLTPESPYHTTPPVTLSHPHPVPNSLPLTLSQIHQDSLSHHHQSPANQTKKESLRVASELTLSLTACPFSREHLRESPFVERREHSEVESVTTMSPLREEVAEDSFYSSFEGSEISDQEGEERRGQRRRRERRLHWEPEGDKLWRETRRMGETVQPRLLTVAGRQRVDSGDLGGEVGSDGTEETLENTPARKISDCSNRSVDSGTKMSEVSKDEDELSHRKLSDLSEASQNDFETVEDEETKRQRKSESPVPTSPSLPPRPMKRRGSVHNKIDFFNHWIQQHIHQSGRRPVGARKRPLVRAQSDVGFTSTDLHLSLSPRRQSLLPDSGT